MTLKSARILAIIIIFGSATLLASALPKDSAFTSEPVPDAVWQQMQGKTYKPNPHIEREDLRYLRVLHWDYDGKTHHGEMVCNKKIADRLITIFRKLYEAKYPIQQMKLPDEYDADDERQMRANNTSCFCYRPVAGSTKLSKHSRGLAVDINPFENPYVRPSRVRPAGASAYADRTKDFPHKIDKEDLCYKLFRAHGFSWGGTWRSVQDYQHFEK